MNVKKKVLKIPKRKRNKTHSVVYLKEKKGRNEQL